MGNLEGQRWVLVNKTESILLFLIAFFILWVYTCVAYPFIAYIICIVAFVILCGFIALVLTSIWYLERKRA